VKPNLTYTYEVAPGEYVTVTLEQQKLLDTEWNPTRESAQAFLNRHDTGLLDKAAEDAQDIWLREREDVLERFVAELRKATGDGSKKRQSGLKPAWYNDNSHEGAIFSHLTKWKRGEKVDPDSGAHPLVHAAWRMMAIACRESGNYPNPNEVR